MEHIDAKEMSSRELNAQIKKQLSSGSEVTVDNPHSMHNIATGMTEDGTVYIEGSTGFYTGGFLEGTRVVVKGNTGWYTGDNMMAGELIIEKNTGCNAGTYFTGGTMIIRGGTGSRVGYAMKGGTIIVCGNSGRWAGQMTLGGELILLGSVGPQIGESMYKGVIYTRDTGTESKLGGNVFIDPLSSQETERLDSLFSTYGINCSPSEFTAIRPATTGRHTYVLFQPTLDVESPGKHVPLKGAAS